MRESIGGYFELELRQHKGFMHDDGILLNTGRNALEYVLGSLPGVKHLWVPIYTCSAVLEPIEKQGIQYSFYQIDQSFELTESISLQSGEYLIYTNYFGIKDDYVGLLAETYGPRLIVDNAQAWYADPIPGVSTIYSPRKFFGVPDGGIAYCPFGIDISQFEQDYSYNRVSHLLKRIDLGPEGGFEEYGANELSFSKQPIRRMSALTKRILEGCDFDHAREVRRMNYDFLKKYLGCSNRLRVAEESYQCPMVYPFLTKDHSLKERLIKNRVFVATYWPNVLELDSPSGWGFCLAQDLVCLPIDQRYGERDMAEIVNLIQHQL